MNLFTAALPHLVLKFELAVKAGLKQSPPFASLGGLRACSNTKILSERGESPGPALLRE